MPLTIAQPPGGITSSLDAGSVTTGAANQVVADSGALNGGNLQPATYVINVTSFQSGTVDANGSNLLVNIGGTNTAGIISGGLTIGKLQTGATFSTQKFRVTVGAGQHVYICVGNTTPGAASVYNASMSVTKAQNPYGDV